MSTSATSPPLPTNEDTEHGPALSLREMEWWLTDIEECALEVCPSCGRHQRREGELVCPACWLK